MKKNKKINFFNRRQFMSYILSVSALASIPKISIASNPDVIVIGAGATRSGLRAAKEVNKIL